MINILFCLKGVINLGIKKYKTFLVFILTFVITLFLVYILIPFFCDEVWTYGFSYNISKGMIIYRDFNVLQTPLYFFINAFFIKIFGSYMICMGVLDSILCALMAVMLYKKDGIKKLFCFIFLLVLYPSSYNLFLTFLCFIILYLIHKNKDNDIIIAFLVSLIFLTKQNIGIIMLIPCLYYSKNRIKTISAFLIPCLILSIYLIYNNAFFNFIDYCFLGLFSFNSNNKYIDILVLCLWIILCLFLIYKLIKCKFKDKALFYTLCFFTISYPIFDFRHFGCCLFIFLSFLNIKSIDIKFNKYFYFLFNIFIFVYVISFLFSLFKVYHLDDINLDRSKFIYLKNSNDILNPINYIHDYLDDNNFDYNKDYVFLGDFYGYFYKLYYDIPIVKYDFFMTGNMGYYNKDKLYSELDEICNKNTCYFFIDDICYGDDNQWSEYANYIDNNYDKIDKYSTINIYFNGK